MKSFILIVTATLLWLTTTALLPTTVGSDKVEVSRFNHEGTHEVSGRLLKKTKKSKAPAKKKKGKSQAPSKKPSKRPSCACVSTLAGFTAQMTSLSAPGLTNKKTITLCPGTTIEIPAEINSQSLPDPATGCGTYFLTIRCGCSGAQTCGLKYTGPALSLTEAPLNFGDNIGDFVAMNIVINGVALSSNNAVPAFIYASDASDDDCHSFCTTNMSPNTIPPVGILCTMW
jgi:hypothetical protein